MATDELVVRVVGGGGGGGGSGGGGGGGSSSSAPTGIFGAVNTMNRFLKIENKIRDQNLKREIARQRAQEQLWSNERRIQKAFEKGYASMEKTLTGDVGGGGKGGKKKGLFEGILGSVGMTSPLMRGIRLGMTQGLIASGVLMVLLAIKEVLESGLEPLMKFMGIFLKLLGLLLLPFSIAMIKLLMPVLKDLAKYVKAIIKGTAGASPEEIVLGGLLGGGAGAMIGGPIGGMLGLALGSLVGGNLGNILGPTLGGLSSGIHAATQALIQGGMNVLKLLSDAGGFFGNLITGAAEWVKTKLEEGGQWMGEAGKGIWDFITNAGSGFYDAVIKAGQDFLKSLNPYERKSFMGGDWGGTTSQFGVGFKPMALQGAIDQWTFKGLRDMLNIPGGSAGYYNLSGKQHGGFIPRSGPYYMHEGEYVNRRGRGGGGEGVTINVNGSVFGDLNEFARIVAERMQLQMRRRMA